jgi:hypothetical protein
MHAVPNQSHTGTMLQPPSYPSSINLHGSVIVDMAVQFMTMHCTQAHCILKGILKGVSYMTPDNFCFYLQKRLVQTSQTGGQQYSDTSPFSIPCIEQ